MVVTESTERSEGHKRVGRKRRIHGDLLSAAPSPGRSVPSVLGKRPPGPPPGKHDWFNSSEIMGRKVLGNK